MHSKPGLEQPGLVRIDSSTDAWGEGRLLVEPDADLTSLEVKCFFSLNEAPSPSPFIRLPGPLGVD